MKLIRLFIIGGVLGVAVYYLTLYMPKLSDPKIEEGQCWIFVSETGDTTRHYIVRIEGDSAECLVTNPFFQNPHVETIRSRWFIHNTVLDSKEVFEKFEDMDYLNTPEKGEKYRRFWE